MRIAILADLHISSYRNDVVSTKTGLPRMLNVILECLSTVTEECINRGIDNIVIAGDIFHDKSIIYTIALNAIIEYFRSYPGVKFTLISGNHDLSGKGKKTSSAIVALREEPNVFWVEDSFYQEETGIFYVSYSFHMTSTIKENSSRYLISHVGVNEAQLSSGLSIISDLRTKDLQNYDKCILGHYHKPQELANIMYVGSLVQLSWNEKNENKRYIVLDTESGDVESIDTRNYPKYIEIGLDESNVSEVMERAMIERESGNYIKIVRLSDKVEISSLVDEGFMVINKGFETVVTNRGITSNMSHSDRNRRYMEIRNIPKEYQEIYEKVGIAIIEKGQGKLI